MQTNYPNTNLLNNDKFSGFFNFSYDDMPDEWGIDLDNFDMEAEIELYKSIEMCREGMAVRLYIPPKKTGAIWITDKAQEDQQFHQCVGFVANVSPDVYKADRFRRNWVEVGKWICFPRHSGDFILYKNRPTFLLWEDSPWFVEKEDPRNVSRS
jgi:hypothetical protein